MTEQDGEGVIGEVEGDQAGRDPRGEHQREPALDFENDQEERGVDGEVPGVIAVQDEGARDRVVGEIDEDEEDDDGKQREA